LVDVEIPVGQQSCILPFYDSINCILEVAFGVAGDGDGAEERALTTVDLLLHPLIRRGHLLDPVAYYLYRSQRAWHGRALWPSRPWFLLSFMTSSFNFGMKKSMI
jgi:hypothetical protein